MLQLDQVDIENLKFFAAHALAALIARAPDDNLYAAGTAKKGIAATAFDIAEEMMHEQARRYTSDFPDEPQAPQADETQVQPPAEGAADA